MERRTTLWFEQALLPNGWASRVRLTLDIGVVTSLEWDVPSEAADERHAIGLPGMPNVHSHAFQRAMAGLTERRGPATGEGAKDNFWSWREQMYRFLDGLGPDEAQALAELVYMEMLEAGFTRVGEFHYLHHDERGTPYADPAEIAARIVAAAAETGIGLTLLPVFYAHANFGGVSPTHGQRRFVTSLDGYEDLLTRSRRHAESLEDAVVGVAPHSLRAVTDAQLSDLLKIAPEGPVHLHAAEQTKEVEDSLAHSGQRPVEWLLDHAPLDVRWCLIHATHMTEDETARLARSGAVAGLCPVTEANLGDGVFPASAYFGARGSFGVGSDSNVLIGLPEELRALEYAQRLTRRERNVLATADRSTGRVLYEGAVGGGARALGTEAGIEVGRAADLLALDANHPGLCGKKGDAILDSFLFATSGGAVETVWRRGRKLVVEGRHIHRDSILGRYRATMKSLLG